MKTLKKISLVLGLLLISSVLFAETDDVYSSLKGKKLGIVTGSSFEQMTKEAFPESEYFYYNNQVDLLQALRAGKVDSYMDDEPTVRYLMVENNDMTHYEELVSHDEYGIGFAKTESGKNLTEKFNKFLAEYKENGKLDELTTKWFSEESKNLNVDFENLPATNGTLTFISTGTTPPFTFVCNGKNTGLEVDLITEFCKKNGYAVKFEIADIAARIPALVSGKADGAFGCMTITEERKQSIYFSDPDYVGGTVMVKLKESDKPVQLGFFESLKNSFYRNFIVENRYKLVLSGLAVTVRISILSAIVGSILAFGICMQRRSKNTILSNTAATFIRIIQGLPVVVFLMILYYIVFKKSKMSSEIVAIIGFSINFGVYVSEMMRTSIDSVDKGQIEAAYALGFKPVKAFVKITAPQALKQMLPVYKGEFISMVKMTSVVGYIAIQDLTKAGDIIRSRTFDAFFPLIATAVMYFVVSYAFIIILNRIEFNLEPKNRKNVLKGVTTK